MLPDTLESSCNNRKPLEAYNYNFLLLIFSKYHHDADNDDDDGGDVEAVKTGVGRSVRALETLLWPFVAIRDGASLGRQDPPQPAST